MPKWFVDVTVRDLLVPVSVEDAALNHVSKVVGYGIPPPQSEYLYAPVTGRLCLGYEVTIEQFQQYSGETFDGYDWFAVAEQAQLLNLSPLKQQRFSHLTRETDHRLPHHRKRLAK